MTLRTGVVTLAFAAGSAGCGAYAPEKPDTSRPTVEFCHEQAYVEGPNEWRVVIGMCIQDAGGNVNHAECEADSIPGTVAKVSDDRWNCTFMLEDGFYDVFLRVRDSAGWSDSTFESISLSSD